MKTIFRASQPLISFIKSSVFLAKSSVLGEDDNKTSDIVENRNSKSLELKIGVWFDRGWILLYLGRSSGAYLVSRACIFSRVRKINR